MIFETIGQVIVYIVMACAVIGAIFAIKDEDSGIGGEFMMAFRQMGDVFIPLAGMMAAAPYIAKFVELVFGQLYGAIGADLAMAPGLLIAIDMGGYQMANALSSSPEGWIMGALNCYMFGPIIAFTIPVGFSMLEKRDHKYFALGIMAGILSIPFGVLISSAILKYSHTPLRGMVSTSSEADLFLHLQWSQILLNILPLAVFCVILALLLRFLTDICVKVFICFGNGLTAAIKISLVLAIVETNTGFLSRIFPWWGFAPIIADETDIMRALEVTGFIAIMLAGAFPLVYLIRRFCEKPLEKAGSKLGFSSVGSAGIVAAAANLLAMFRLLPDMEPEDKVKNVAFGVCGAWLLGDHIAFTANFQPNLLGILMIGKLLGAIIAIFIAKFIAVPVARRYAQKDRADGVISEDEYRAKEQLLPYQRRTQA